MPKLGMEPIRKAALVKATIAEIGMSGAQDVTVGSIARRAGMSSALAHHYFGGKEQIFLAAMRHILSGFGAGVRAARAGAATPRGRVEAVIRASFEGDNFDAPVIAAWLNFYVLAQNAPEVRRLLTIYQRRLHSHLVFDLRPLLGPARAGAAAQGIGAMIDGVYIRQALQEAAPDPAAAARPVLDYLDFWIAAAGDRQ